MRGSDADMVMVGDRGMISQKAIDEMQASDGIGWITALKSVSIRAPIEQGQLQLGLFDETNLLELSSPEYPGERLVACRNPQLAKLRAHKREQLLCATEKNLEKIKVRVDAAKLTGQDAVGVRVGKVINQYKVAKHFELAIGETTFSFGRKPDSIAAEAALDGLYNIRTSVPAQQMRTYELPLSIALVPAGFAIANVVIGIRIALHLMSGTASQPPCADYQS